jgi:hypothetical protein
MLIERKEEPGRKLTKAEGMKKLDAMKERDQQLVTGVFRYIEHKGGTLRFRFHKYPDDGYPQYELQDGQIYKLPRMVARHLNQNVHYREYKHLDKQMGELGVHAAYNDGRANTHERMHVVNKSPRCEFKSLEFMDDDLELNPINLSEVRKGTV